MNQSSPKAVHVHGQDHDDGNTIIDWMGHVPRGRFIAPFARIKVTITNNLWKIMPMNAPPAKIPPDEIHYDFIRASGPGGQNINKVATAVQLRFDARNSRSIAPEIKERLIQLAGRRAIASGEIIIDARRFRTQQRNREDALQRLFQLIEKASVPPRIRHKSRPTATSNLRRLREKKRRSEIKKLRNRDFET